MSAAQSPEPLPSWVDPEAVNPARSMCLDCFHLERCRMLFNVNPTNRWCDWVPSRYVRRVLEIAPQKPQ